MPSTMNWITSVVALLALAFTTAHGFVEAIISYIDGASVAEQADRGEQQQVTDRGRRSHRTGSRSPMRPAPRGVSHTPPIRRPTSSSDAARRWYHRYTAPCSRCDASTRGTRASTTRRPGAAGPWRSGASTIATTWRTSTPSNPASRSARPSCSVRRWARWANRAAHRRVTSTSRSRRRARAGIGPSARCRVALPVSRRLAKGEQLSPVAEVERWVIDHPTACAEAMADPFAPDA